MLLASCLSWLPTPSEACWLPYDTPRQGMKDIYQSIYDFGVTEEIALPYSLPLVGMSSG